jgi:DivIVA domain-containing protein
MPLTPADVHNVAFSKPPIGKRGYNEDEVDAFLDLVENELARLVEENSDLRQRVGELDQELGSARTGGGTAQAIPLYQPESEAEPAPVERVHEAQAAPALSQSGEEISLRAARVLALAQETADRLTGTARADADKVLSDARTNADATLNEAKRNAETTVADARSRADALLADAQARSEAQVRQAQDKADALQADAERKHSEIMGSINQQRTVLEGRLEQLRTFEREYRTRLKTYLESQLEELGQRGSAAPVDNAGNEAGFSQFNRGNN